jgi:transcriptional regulator with XRE-family HTH domain
MKRDTRELHLLQLKLGKRAQDIRERKGYTQESLAAVSGLDRVSIGYIEQGRRAPQLSTLLILSKSLQVKLSEFFDSIYPRYFFGVLHRTLHDEIATDLEKRQQELNEILFKESDDDLRQKLLEYVLSNLNHPHFIKNTTGVSRLRLVYDQKRRHNVSWSL